MTGKNVKGVRMTREVVNPIFRGDIAVMCGLPDDAKFQRFYRNGARDELIFVFESDEFERLGEGEKIPLAEVNARSVDADVRKHKNWKKL